MFIRQNIHGIFCPNNLFSLHKLLFLKNYLQTVSNNSFKIYIDGETPSSVTNNAEMKRFLETFNTSKNPLVGSTTMSPNKGKKS